MFKQLDFFPKVLEDQPFKKTVCGGILFLITFLTISALILNETYLTFIQGELITEQYVDTSHVDERIRVNLNISFHKVPCIALTLDLQDVTGTHLEDVQYTLHKLSMNEHGVYTDPSNAQRVQKFEHSINYPSNPLFRLVKKLTDSNEDIVDCYGSQLYEGQKCITCQDVMSAYAARNWPQPPKEAVAQCMPNHVALIKKRAAQQQQRVFIQGPDGQVQQININVNGGPDIQNGLPPANQQRLLQENSEGKDFEHGMKQQIVWQLKDVVIDTIKLMELKDKWINLTSLTRNDCGEDIKINIRLTGSQTKWISIKQDKQQCESSLQYKVNQVGQEIKIEMRLGDQNFQWDFSFGGDHNQKILEFEITGVEGSYYVPQKEKSKFVFIIVENSNRKLFVEDFGHEILNQQQIIYMSDLEQIHRHKNEGCQLYGHFFIRKVPGNFHISFHGKGQAAQLLTQQFSIEHTIHLLEFTEEKQELTLGRQIKSTNPIDGVKQQNGVEQDSQYYLKIVGGRYIPLWSSESKLYTFTSHESKKHSDQRLPQIEFKYEFDAITMIYTFRNHSIFQFLVSLFAIIGGVFSVSNLFSSVLEKVGL